MTNDYPRYLKQLQGVTETPYSSGRISVNSAGQDSAANPIFYLEVTPDGCDQDAKPILIAAVVHGDEPAGAYAALHLMANPTGKRRQIIIPVANPSGFKAGTRQTAPTVGDPIDVNRDFVALATPEAKAIAAVIDKTDPEFLISLHEDVEGQGIYLYHSAKMKSHFYRPLLTDLGPDVSTDPRPTIEGLKNDDGLIYYDLAAGLDLNAHEDAPEGESGEWSARSTLEDYMLYRRKNYLTVETPLAWPLTRRVETQRKIVERMLNQLE